MPGFGGAINAWGDMSSVINCTFYGNTAGSCGGAIALGGGDAVIKNSILWGDSASTVETNEISINNTNLDISYSDIEGYPVSGSIINDDPQFKNPDSDDLDALSLKSNSPCIDAGINSALPTEYDKDILGLPRIVDIPGIGGSGTGIDGFAIDMGAYEYQ